MWIKEIVIILFGLAGGCVVAGGVFTVFTAVGLIPRFAEQTGSADHILLYENMLIVLLVIRSVIFVICSVCGGVMGVNRDEKIRF